MLFEGPVRVLIVDDHVAIRSGIAKLINAEWPRMRSIGAAGTSQEALTLARTHQPDVVVLDVNLAGDDGLLLIPLLQQLAPCEVIVLTSLSDPRVSAHARRLGAHACLHKTAPASELVDCLIAAHLARMGLSPLDQGGHVSHAIEDQIPGDAGQER